MVFSRWSKSVNTSAPLFCQKDGQQPGHRHDELSVKSTANVFRMTSLCAEHPQLPSVFCRTQTRSIQSSLYRINRGARIEKTEQMNRQLQYIRPNASLSPTQHRAASAGPTGEAVLKQQRSPRRLQFSSVGRAYAQQSLVVCCCACCSLSGTASAGLRGADR